MDKKTIGKMRIKKELEMFQSSPPPGISCSCVDDQLNKFSAQIMGAIGTPFEGGIFTLDVQLTDSYPFEPPSIRFVTPIYHPNVDTLGRICLDTLKPPPQGSWKPHLNLSAVLMMIRVLMAEPGEEDPLMSDVWQEYKYDYVTYDRKAREWTQRHAHDTAHAPEVGTAVTTHSPQGQGAPVSSSDVKNDGLMSAPPSCPAPPSHSKPVPQDTIPATATTERGTHPKRPAAVQVAHLPPGGLCQERQEPPVKKKMVEEFTSSLDGHVMP